MPESTLGRPAPRFRSWLMGGFEGSTMALDTGRRVDVIARSGHDTRAEADYHLLASLGVGTVRDAMRWHIIERRPGLYDWSSVLPMVRASARAGVEIIWDLCHFGLPDDVDAWDPALADRFARFVRAAATLIKGETDAAPLWCPVNEISYWAFAGGDRGHIAPLGRGRGLEWKRQLARLAIAACRTLREVDPRARLIHADPVIHIVGRRPDQGEDAEFHRRLMFDAWDMIAGRRDRDLGGSPAWLDVVGVNFYGNNQWHHYGATIPRGAPDYKPFRAILAEVWARYRRPIVITETGAEGVLGPDWLRYVAVETRAAMDAGVPIAGLCVYPVMDYPGWANDRHCRCGPIVLDGDFAERRLDPAMADALASARATVGAAAPGEREIAPPRLRIA